jgi:hypothetical protein
MEQVPDPADKQGVPDRLRASATVWGRWQSLRAPRRDRATTADYSGPAGVEAMYGCGVH